ncbi:IS5 family transposase [Marinobacter sp. LV10R520-4]|nr:IS5 family transposase [Marinobacter sp. LV10R520-4]
MKQTSSAQAEFAAKKKITRRERFLAEMEQAVPWSRLLEALSPHYYLDSRGKRGRPPIPLKRILRMYFVQQWYALADDALEDAIYDSQASVCLCRYRPGCGIGSGRHDVAEVPPPVILIWSSR